LPLRAAFDAAAAEGLSSRCPLAAARARACVRCWLFQWFFTALSSRPAWIYEGALLFVTEISCKYRDSLYKGDLRGTMAEGPRPSRPGSSFAIAGHVGRGTVASAFFSTASSHSLHDPRFTRGTAAASAGSVGSAAAGLAAPWRRFLVAPACPAPAPSARPACETSSGVIRSNRRTGGGLPYGFPVPAFQGGEGPSPAFASFA
jgi:hypothetical protein